MRTRIPACVEPSTSVIGDVVPMVVFPRSLTTKVVLVDEPIAKGVWPAVACIDSVANGLLVPTPTLLLLASTLNIELEEASVNVKALVLLFCGMKIAEELAPLKEKVVVPFCDTEAVYSFEGSYWTLNCGVETEVMVSEPELLIPPA